MVKYVVFVFFIFLIMGAMVTLIVSRDDRTIDNLSGAIQDGSEEALDQTVGRARKSILQFRYEVRQRVRDTADMLNEGVRRTEQMALDGSCTAAIKMKFVNDEIVPGSRIDVDTKNGVVTLKGTVLRSDEAERAVELAYTVEGVDRVISKLQIQERSA